MVFLGGSQQAEFDFDIHIPPMSSLHASPGVGVPVTERDRGVTQRDRGVTQRDRGVTQCDRGVTTFGCLPPPKGVLLVLANGKINENGSERMIRLG